MDIQIREIKSDDLKDFEEFYEELADESDYMPFSADEVEEKLEKMQEKGKLDSKHKQLFIALEDDKIVGFLGIARGHFAKLTHRARFMVGVLEEYQRQGIASKLIDYAEEWAKDNDVKRLELTVIEGNDPAIALFEKKDYVKECTHKSAVLNGDEEYTDEVMMAKIL